MPPDSGVHRRPSRSRLTSAYFYTPARPTDPQEQPAVPNTPAAPAAADPEPELREGGSVRDWILGLYFLSPLCRWLQPALYARAWEYKRVLEERRRRDREQQGDGQAT